TSDLLAWTPKLLTAPRGRPKLTDLNPDQQQNGLQADLKIDRLTMRRFGLLPSAIDNTLYDAFGERQVSTIYNAMNQYSVVMEVAPQYWQSPDTLKKLYVSTQGQNASGTESTNAVVGTFSAGSSASTNSNGGANTSRSTRSSVNQATNS